MTFFLKTTLADIYDVVRVKNIQGSVQPLVAFPISNISNCCNYNTTVISPGAFCYFKMVVT